MARGSSVGPSFGFARPGRALIGVMVGLLAIWLFFALGINWGGASEELFLALSGNTGLILQGEIWRLFTPALLHIHSETPWHIGWALLMLFMWGPRLEDEWGAKRFLRFLAGSAVFAYTFQALVVLALPDSIGGKLAPTYWFGSAPVLSAVTIAWALSFRGRTVNILFLGPLSSRTLIMLVIGIDVMVLIAQAHPPEGLVSSFGGMLAGWLFGSAGPSPLRRMWLKLRLAQLDAEARREADARKKRVARSGLQVLEGGRARLGRRREETARRLAQLSRPFYFLSILRALPHSPTSAHLDARGTPRYFLQTPDNSAFRAGAAYAFYLVMSVSWTPDNPARNVHEGRRPQ